MSREVHVRFREGRGGETPPGYSPSYYPRKKLKGPLARKVLGGENAKGRAQGGDGLGPAG